MDRPRILFGPAAQLVLAGLLLGFGTSSVKAAASTCNFGHGIKHVVQIQFDNVHLRRDNPNVPSDLEQMPNLLNFMLNHGTVSGNHFTPLISHTANDIVTTLTGVYPDRHGVPVANTYRVFDSSNHPSSSHPSFIYWTATDATDGKPVLLNEIGKNTPAPWVPFTRAGCDFGAYSIANMEFETLPGDVGVAFGTNSPEFAAVQAELGSSNPAIRQKANTDWLGIAVHCAQNSKLCANGKPDLLPDEPGPDRQPGPNQYVGFKALFGNINVQPVISPSGPVKDLDGNVIADAFGQPGFPNIFSPPASRSYTPTSPTRTIIAVGPERLALARPVMLRSFKLMTKRGVNSSPGLKRTASTRPTRCSFSLRMRTITSLEALPRPQTAMASRH